MTPISFQFIAAGIGNQLKGNLYRFEPSRKGSTQHWLGRDGDINGHNPRVPITNRGYWEGRYVLCELTLEKSDGERLTMNDVVCSINRSKNIVTTQMVGMKGTVKEYIDEGDFQITLAVGIAAVEEGRIVDKYPEEGIREVRKFLDETAAIKIYSKFLDIFEIDKIVVKSYSLTQMTEANYQALSISAMSDSDYNVYSTEY